MVRSNDVVESIFFKHLEVTFLGFLSPLATSVNALLVIELSQTPLIAALELSTALLRYSSPV